MGKELAMYVDSAGVEQFCLVETSPTPNAKASSLRNADLQ